jgi:hypothetical protein
MRVSLSLFRGPVAGRPALGLLRAACRIEGRAALFVRNVTDDPKDSGAICLMQCHRDSDPLRYHRSIGVLQMMSRSGPHDTT